MPGISIPIPVIGYGCGAITSIGEKKAHQVLGAAFDAGVRHFDVARYYGYGESEGVLGRFVKGRRAEVTITTKFGIAPPRRTNALRLAMQVGRRLVKLVPAARGVLRSRAQGMVKGGAFGVNDARASLETSLRELGVDTIDFYLLHDYVVSGDLPDELVEFLTGAIRAGKIRYFGLGTGIENILRALQTQPQLCGVLQFENSVLRRNMERLPQNVPHRPTITHGSLSADFAALTEFLKNRADVARKWSTELAVDCSSGESISALMLNYSVRKNPEGLVLFSSRDASRAAKNARAVLEPDVSPEQVELFGQLVERDFVPASAAR